jgi:hypothetical protein
MYVRTGDGTRAERRRSRRITPPDSIEVRVNSRIQARIVDISTLGAQLEVASALSPASTCNLAVTTDSGLLFLRARVQRCRAAAVPASDGDHGSQLVYLAGVEFIDLGAEDARRLQTVCRIPQEITTKPQQTQPAAAGNNVTTRSIEQLMLAV